MGLASSELDDDGFQQTQRSGVGINFRNAADRQRKLVRDMTEKRPLISRDAQAAQMLRQYVVQRERAIAGAFVHAVCALPKHDAFQVLQHTCLPQLREHAVNAIAAKPLLSSGQ